MDFGTIAIIILVVFVVFAMASEPLPKCEICGSKMTSTEGWRIDIDGVSRLVCPKCHRKIDNKNRNEKFESFFGGSPHRAVSQSNRYIPTEVKNEVWRRDGGRCSQCGSQERIEYDHIIPISKGGSNTSRNIQILCQNCNRKKHNKIQ